MGKSILEDLKIQWSRRIKLYCDDKSAINIAHNLVLHDLTKHFEIDKHFIKEKLDSGLCSNVFHENISKLGVEDLYSPALRVSGKSRVNQGIRRELGSIF